MKTSTVFFIIGIIFIITLVVNHGLIMRSNIENIYVGAFVVSLQLIFIICAVGSFYNYGLIKGRWSK